MALRFGSIPRVSAGQTVIKQQQATEMPQFLISSLLVLAVAATTSIADENPRFKITTQRDNDPVDLKNEKDNVAFSVHSPFGISNAVVRRPTNPGPLGPAEVEHRGSPQASSRVGARG
jgi:hypothetical protein